MNTEHPNGNDLDRIAGMLTPRHTPECGLSFTPPRSARAAGLRHRLVGYMLRIAAIMIIGVGIGYAIRSDHTALAARKSTEVGISRFFGSKECRVRFEARLKDPADIRFRLSPRGELVPASLLWQKEKQIVTLTWMSDAGEQKIVFSPDRITSYTAGREVSTRRTRTGGEMLEIFNMSADRLLAKIKSRTTSMVRTSDSIVITASNKDEKTELVISEPDGRIQSLTLTDPKSGKLMLRTNSISY